MAGQSAAGVCSGLLGGLQALFPSTGEVLVCVGPPGDYLPDLIISLGEWRAPVTRPTQGPTRSRESAFEIDVIFSGFVAGGPEAQLAANDLAWAAGEEFEAWLRTQPNETINGACRDSWVSNKTLMPETAYQVPDGMTSPVPVGRTATVTVTVSAAIRY